MKRPNIIMWPDERRASSGILSLMVSLGLAGALTGCGAVGGSVSGGEDQPSIGAISKIELIVHTDNAPADGETSNIVLVRGKNAQDQAVSGFTPALNVNTGVEYECTTAAAAGESVCLLKTSAPGKVNVTVANLVSGAMASSMYLGKSVTITFKAKQAPRPGVQVGGGTTIAVGRVDPDDTSSPVLAQVTSVMGEFIVTPESEGTTKAAQKDVSQPADDLSDPMNPRYYYRLISNLLGTMIWQ